MKKLVLDANVIFAVLIKGNEKITKLIENNKIYVPDYMLFEIEKYEDKIRKRTKIDEEEFRELILDIFEEIIVVPKLYLDKRIRERSKEMCKDTDKKDAPYIALVMQLGDAILITSDKKLIECAKRNGIEVLSLYEALEKIG